MSDPRSEEWRESVDAHLRWWADIWQDQKARGMTVTTVTPEFGPFPYQHTLPNSGGQPVADCGEVNDWIAQEVLAKFKEVSKSWS